MINTRAALTPPGAAGWQPIESLVLDGRLVEVLSAGGESVIPAVEPVEMSFAMRKELAKSGVWPDHQRWAHTHWRELTPPGETK